MSKLSFLDIPHDVLLLILSFIAPQDILALKQTCRVLHAFGCMDYVWHQCKVNLPLDLPLGVDEDVTRLSGNYLQRSIIDSLRLENNWRKKTSHVRSLRLLRLSQGDIVYQLRFLGPKWLMILSSSPLSTTNLSLWNISGQNARCSSSLKIPPATKLAAALQKDGNSVLAAVSCHIREDVLVGYLNVYSFPLNDDEVIERANSGVPRLIVSVAIEKESGVFVEVQISGNIVAASTVRFDNFDTGITPSPIYHLYFVNGSTAATVLVRPDIPADLLPMRFQMCPDHIIIVGNRKAIAVLAVYIFAFPEQVYSIVPTIPIDPSMRQIFGPTEAEECGPVIAHFTCKLPADSDFYLSPEACTYYKGKFSVIAFHSPLQTRAGIATFQFPLDPKRPIVGHVGVFNPVHEFLSPESATPEIVCVGKTGQRAVWLERIWDYDNFRLVKASFPGKGETPMLESLMPQHLALPFEMHTCQSLSFHEASGRVCLGLHTGEVYIIQF